jgi:hypothetical protein
MAVTTKMTEYTGLTIFTTFLVTQLSKQTHFQSTNWPLHLTKCTWTQISLKIFVQQASESAASYDFSKALNV